ncbi:ribonuclease E/G [Ovoidimarina sediminis]|uniref:ribonuclease E/G n=1 Tax=Ovoidimarina sediminis TaxID=3079856 RepID=UPI00290BA3BF|nr:ribonuclease E/G [Rhodophyticola sp. MJ-SS7]MDU8945841.1 ribonuclease E/G [Rhodophyticola sp. MJ-SS7]
MKGRVLAIGDRRAALMIDGRLEDLVLLPRDPSLTPSTGEIRVARVTRILPNGRGAFCDLGPAGDGFLRQPGALKAGDRIAAQVAGLPEPGKAVPLTTRLLFKGPRLILTPEAPGVNVSRKIGNTAERDRLTEAVAAALARAGAPEPSPGVIIRSAARGEEAEALDRELQRLLAAWRNIPKHLAHDDPPGRVIEEYALPRVLAEWLFPLPDEILCTREAEEGYRTLHPAPGSALGDEAVNFWGDPRPVARLRAVADPFEAAGAADALAALMTPDVAVGPATMAIEATRALVAVDVNTGGDFSPAAGLKANLAAARDLPRQLRLRGLGGQIVVDFAPQPKKDRRTLEEALKKAFRDDPVDTALVGWTSMGLYEMQRKRERRPLGESLP